MTCVEKLKRLEGLAQRKASVYGRVLTDVTLAEEMQALAEFHGERMQEIASLLGEEVKIQKEDAEDEA